jgi:hypothetical protein
VPDLVDLLPERYRRVAGRLIRRRMHRYDRGLPTDLTEPVSAAEAGAAPLPVETVATGPRPPSAVAAATLLAVLGGMVIAVAAVELGRPVIGLVTEPAVDGMTKLVQLVFAGFLGAIAIGMMLIGVAHGYAAWRIWRGVNWAFVEGLAVVAAGIPFAVISFGLTDAGEWQLNPALLLAMGAYVSVAVAILASRDWLGPVRFPLNPERAPWWMRLRDRWR